MPTRTLPRPTAFTVAAASLITVFFSSGTPVPLYNLYRTQNGITDGDLALTTVVYLAVTALSLLVLGRLSDHIGRRPLAIAAVIASMLGLLLLMGVHGLPMLLTGRALQGIACGIASSALGAMVIDTAPRQRARWLPTVITSSAPAFAIPIGALLSGALAQYAPAPRQLTYTIVVAVLIVCGALLFFCAETVTRNPGALRSLRPQVHVPTGAGRAVLATGATLVATWSFTSYYQAFSPGLAADYLGTSDPLLIALVFASIIVLSPVGGILTGRLRPTTAQALGLGVFIAAVAAALVALHSTAIVPFLLISALAGISQGAANTGGMGAVLGHVAPTDRAGTLATLYLISYAGAATPGLIAGQLTTTLSLPDIGIGYGILAALAATTTFVALTLNRKEQRRQPGSTEAPPA